MSTPWVRPDLVAAHMLIIEALRAGATVRDAARDLGLSQPGVNKLLAVYGRPEESSHSYPTHPHKCPTCRATITKAPCWTCKYQSQGD